MIEQTIKPSDLVYYPTLSNKAFECFKDVLNPELLQVRIHDHILSFDSKGNIFLNAITPSVYLATPENKKKLEEFYGIQLEDVQKTKEETFLNLLDDLSQAIAEETKQFVLIKHSPRIKDKLFKMYLNK